MMHYVKAGAIAILAVIIGKKIARGKRLPVI